MQIALGSVFGNAAHDLVPFIRRLRHLAAIEVDGESNLALIRKLGCLFLHPVVQSPIFMNQDDRGEWTVSRWGLEKALDGFIVALVGDSFTVGCSGDGGEG